MQPFQPYLIGLLAALMLIPLAVLIAHRGDRKRRESWHALERGRRKRNIAEYRTWQWLYGKPKPKRIADLRDRAARK